jgi:hypothetical protein
MEFSCIFIYLFIFQDAFKRVLEVEIGIPRKNSEYRGKSAAASMARSADSIIRVYKMCPNGPVLNIISTSVVSMKILIR